MNFKPVAMFPALCAAFIFIVIACVQAATQDDPAVLEVPRTDQNSLTAHAQLLEKTQKGRIDVYFEGDSIARRWGATDYPRLLENWNENFYGWNAANFAWGGDTTRNILWRLNDGELDGVHPRVIILQAGTNDLGWRPPVDGGKAKVEEITKGIEAIIDVMKEKAPEAIIILTGIFPRNDIVAWIPTIQETNRNLEKLADGKKIRYININDKLADADGMLYEGMTDPDKLHLALAGYQIWADALKPLLTELLGPPAKEDHAPPPTGDPSAGK